LSVDDNGASLTVDNAQLSVVGSGTEAAALRVTIASDSTGVLSVDDNGSSLTVDGTVTVGSITAGTNYIGKVRLTDGTTDGEVVPLAGYNAQAVAIVDGSGNQITTFGGGTQYTEDAAAAADPVGTAPILVRADTPATVTSTDGDNVAQRGTNYGAAYTQIVTSAGAYVDSFGGGTEYTEDAAAAANPVGNAQILVRQDTPATLTTTDGDNVARRGTNYGAAFSQIVTSAGAFVDSFGGGTQYTEADTDASITGTAMMMEGAANALAVAQAGGGTEATALRVTVASDSTGVLSVDDNGGSLTVDGTVSTAGYFVTCSTDVTRDANTTTYAINDWVGTSTGGFTFTNAGRASGGSGIITDCWVCFEEDAATPLQGEIWIFDAAVSNSTDNSAFALTDADAKLGVGRINFTLEDIGNHGAAHIPNLNIGYTCSGSANLRFHIRARNAYVPTTNSSVLTVRIKCLQVT
jgi:hypothetical protein